MAVLNSTYLAPPRSGSSIASLLSLSSIDRSMVASPPRPRRKRFHSSTSATVRTLDSLERLSPTIRNTLVIVDKEQQPNNIPSHNTVTDYQSGNTTIHSDPSTSLELSISNHKMGPTFSGTISDISGHSRDSSIFSMNELNDIIPDTSLHPNYATGDNAAAAVTTAIPPPPPPPSSRQSPYRSMTSPYRSRKHHHTGMTTMMTMSGVSPTMARTLRKVPSRSHSLESLTEVVLDFSPPPPSLRETEEDG